MEINSNQIQFYLNGDLVSESQIEPTQSVLSYLRNNLRLIGSKEGCAEGDCGACTVVVAELTDNSLELRAVNACIQFVTTLHGKALFTVEYLRKKSGDLHPVQQAMVDCHGSQCGFCTPGFIMSLWNVYLEHKQQGTIASDKQLRSALSGNLCRCTGYKPILAAGKQMFELPDVDFDQQALVDQLKELKTDESFEYRFNDVTFFSPKSIQQFTKLNHDYPNATLLAGCTDIGLWVNKQFRDLGDIIYIGNVAELKQTHVENEHLYIGAGVPLDDAFESIADYYPEISEQWERFASLPIRNAGTLGGNIANGSPIGDSMPWLITLGTQVKLTSAQGFRTILLEELYVDYMKKSMTADEFVEQIIVPINQLSYRFRTYKLSKRYDSDISAVCAAFAVKLDEGQISDAKIAFGGMAAIPKRATQTEAVLIGEQWNDKTIDNAVAKLSSDYSPLTDMRASDKNRLKSAKNLLYRFYLETRSDKPLASDQVSVFETQE